MNATAAALIINNQKQTNCKTVGFAFRFLPDVHQEFPAIVNYPSAEDISDYLRTRYAENEPERFILRRDLCGNCILRVSGKPIRTRELVWTHVFQVSADPEQQQHQLLRVEFTIKSADPASSFSSDTSTNNDLDDSEIVAPENNNNHFGNHSLSSRKSSSNNSSSSKQASYMFETVWKEALRYQETTWYCWASPAHGGDAVTGRQIVSPAATEAALQESRKKIPKMVHMNTSAERTLALYDKYGPDGFLKKSIGRELANASMLKSALNAEEEQQRILHEIEQGRDPFDDGFKFQFPERLRAQKNISVWSEIENWFNKYCNFEPNNRRLRRCALVLFSETRGLGKTKFAEEICGYDLSKIFWVRGSTFTKENFEQQLKAKLLLLDDFQWDMKCNKMIEIMKALVVSERVNINFPWVNETFHHGLPTILTINSRERYEQMKKSPLFNTSCIFVEVLSYMGPPEHKPESLQYVSRPRQDMLDPEHVVYNEQDLARHRLLHQQEQEEKMMRIEEEEEKQFRETHPPNNKTSKKLKRLVIEYDDHDGDGDGMPAGSASPERDDTAVYRDHIMLTPSVFHLLRDLLHSDGAYKSCPVTPYYNHHHNAVEEEESPNSLIEKLEHWTNKYRQFRKDEMHWAAAVAHHQSLMLLLQQKEEAATATAPSIARTKASRIKRVGGGEPIAAAPIDDHHNVLGEKPIHSETEIPQTYHPTHQQQQFREDILRSPHQDQDTVNNSIPTTTAATSRL